MSLVSIKFTLNEDVRRIKVSKQITYPDMLSLLKSLFKLPDSDWESLSLKYLDNEGDKCTVTGEQELREAFHAKKDDVLKLELSFPSNKVEFVQSPFVNAIRRRIQQDQLLHQQQQQQQQQQQPELAQSSFANAIKRRLEQHQQQQQQQPEARRCGFTERVNRRATIFGLAEEGIALMDAQKYNEAKEVFANQAEMFRCPWKKSVPFYNIACCEALLGNIDSALAYLAKAINCGYKNVQHMDQDKDLDSLRGLDGFEVMMGEIRNAPQVEKKKECRWKGRFQNMNCHQQREAETKTENVITSPSAEVKEEKTEKIEICPVFSTVTGEVVGEIKSTPIAEPVAELVVGLEQKTEVAFEPVSTTEPVTVASEPVEFEAELNSLFQMGFTNIRKNQKMLRKTNGNLSEAVVLLLR
jgi:tetratricopeptide (TPR) repeat protein